LEIKSRKIGRNFYHESHEPTRTDGGAPWACRREHGRGRCNKT